MNYRIASLLASEAATTAATKTIDINVATPISRILVEYKATNGDSVPDGHPAKIVSKIELVDGSNVIFSLSGVEAQALNHYETGRIPGSALNFVSGQQAIASFEINFGRWLWDPILAFDPKKYMNPQLKISHNIANGGSSVNASTMSVFAFMFDAKPVTPTGFLLSKEQLSYTLVASAKENIDLAVDLPYRFLMIKSLTGGKQPFENFNKIKLSQDNDQVVIINDESTSDIIKMTPSALPFSELIRAADMAGGVTLYNTATMWETLEFTGLGTQLAAGNSGVAYGGSFTATIDAGETAQILSTGLCPHGALILPFGDVNDIADFYDVSKVGSLKLVLTAGSGASGTVEIVSQQLKLYGK